MPLPPDHLNSPVRITTFGDLLGTGFLLRVPGDPEPHLYAVTAHHVIREQIGVEVQAAKPSGNGELYDPEPISNWRQPLPNVDLAIALFEGRHGSAYEGVWLDWVIPFNGLERPDLGAHVYYLGVFEPLKRPMARSGRIGALFQAGIPHQSDYYEFDAHLVDCRSYDGFSGSPVLVETSFPVLDPAKGPGWVPDQEAPLGAMHHFTVLCGMFTGHYSDEGHPSSVGAVSRYGVGVMLPSDQIKGALMTEEIVAERSKRDEERPRR